MAERVRFYTDEHVSKAVIEGLRRRGVDVLGVPEAGMLGTWNEPAMKGECCSHTTQTFFASTRQGRDMPGSCTLHDRTHQSVKCFTG